MNVAKLRYAPEFRVFISGKPVPAALRASISSVMYQTGIEGSDRVELTLLNERLRWLDHELLSLGRELKLEIGYAPDPLQQVFVGDIVSQSASFPSSGEPSLVVVAQDRMQRLQRGMPRPRFFAAEVPLVGLRALPDPAIASLIGVENGLLPTVDTVGAFLAAVLGSEGAGVAGIPELGAEERSQSGEAERFRSTAVHGPRLRLRDDDRSRGQSRRQEAAVHVAREPHHARGHARIRPISHRVHTARDRCGTDRLRHRVRVARSDQDGFHRHAGVGLGSDPR